MTWRMFEGRDVNNGKGLKMRSQSPKIRRYVVSNVVFVSTWKLILLWSWLIDDCVHANRTPLSTFCILRRSVFRPFLEQRLEKIWLLGGVRNQFMSPYVV